MVKLSHRIAALSMLVALTPGGAMAAATAPAYAGRWTVSDDKPAYSSRGIFYRTIDVARCGNDYCGVSVGANGRCGPMLFRFLATNIRRGGALAGHGRWGNARKNVELWQFAEKAVPGGKVMGINLGDGHDFGERSGNMPKFSAQYRPIGAARCMAR